MKTKLLLFLVSAVSAHAQFKVDWSTMDGGGGSGTAGTYSMRGTIGQIDANTGSAGNVLFHGGYWSVPDEESPVLRIFRSGSLIVLAWPNPSPGFNLQASPGLNPSDWLNVSIAPTVVDKEKQVTWGRPDGAHFFRLHRP
jgi:hypothetical protein